MSAVTVTYQELPPMASWATDGLHHHGMVENGGASLMHFSDARAQYHDNGNSASGWNPFCLDGTEVKCDSGHTAGMEAPSPADWAIGGGLLGSPITDGPPPPYGAPHHMSMYGGDAGTYSYECAPGGGKKRFSHVRPTTASPHGPAGLVGIGGGNGGPGMAPEELCLVCGDKASGYHYNALTCEGCKGFFRRSITRKAMYYCKYGGHCDIDMYMRRKCQACRLRKCLDIGMRPELVIPEEQCRLKRESKNKMRTVNGGSSASSSSSTTSTTPVMNADERKSNSPQQVTSTDSLSPNPPMQGLTPEQRELVHRLVRYQEEYEMPSDEELTKLSAFRNEHQQNHTHFQHLAELTILNVQLIVEFTKHLPGFLTLNKDDQLTLLKACSTEILMLKTARRYDQKTDTIVLGNRTTSWAYSRDAYKQAGMGSATDAIFEFAKSMAKLRVDAAEFALLTAISIFSERPGLSEPRKVEDIQEVYTSTLQAYIDVHRPKNRTVFARLLMKLTDLRTLGCEQADVLFSLKVNSNQNNGQCRLPISLTQLGGSDESKEGASSSQIKSDPRNISRQHSQQQQQAIDQQLQNQSAECPLAGQGSANHRVPNVRIKVEPLTSSTPSNGLSLNQQYGSSANGDELGNAYECHSTLYLPAHDDVNNNNNHRYHQHDEAMHQQQAVSSSTFPDTMSKWN